MTMSHV